MAKNIEIGQCITSFDVAAKTFKVLANAIVDAGGTYTDIRRIETDAKLRREIAKLVVGEGKKSVDHIIDCDAAPFVPEGWQVEEHKRGGQLTWDPSRITLHLSDNQKGDKRIEGNKLRKELENLPVLNANVLDFLLKHPDLIPEEWKRDEKGNTRYIFFWGTIYRSSDGSFCVRCLDWRDDEWSWDYLWLGRGWHCRDPAAVLAS